MTASPPVRSVHTVDGPRVLRLWWPLAASWMLMGLELPLVTAVLARLAEPEVNLAAYGSLVFPVSVLIEAPIIMLLAASTVLATDREAWRRLARFTALLGGALTAVHVAVAFTPLYDLLARDLIGVPDAVAEPGRLGLRIMTPWTSCIAWRRFQQGVLIRFERSRSVGAGTLVRLGAGAGTLLAAAYWLPERGLPGVAVGATAVVAGVLAEALFIQYRAAPLVRQLAPRPDGPPLTGSRLLAFYVPLALTPLMALLVQPLGAAAMSRMPHPLDSLAAWPAVHGFVFLLRGIGLSFNEVVVRLVPDPGGAPVLRRFAQRGAALLSGFLLLVALTPLGPLWFESISGLSPELADLSQTALLLSVLMPGYAMLQSWYQGRLVSAHRTRPIPEAVGVYLVFSAVLLGLGVAAWAGPGIHFVIPALTVAGIGQTVWLGLRSRSAPRARDGA